MISGSSFDLILTKKHVFVDHTMACQELNSTVFTCYSRSCFFFKAIVAVCLKDFCKWRE